MALVSMKTESDNTVSESSNEYGYGLRIRLNDDQCEALGITSPIKPGTKVSINAVAIVHSATESVEDDGDDTGNDIFMELQITDMELGATGSRKDTAAALYGADET
ncbi:MAG: hypothetical protein PHP57_13460 [Sideroxydans sp.]|nr:hypothetical protein [Sideroxydans sp.]